LVVRANRARITSAKDFRIFLAPLLRVHMFFLISNSKIMESVLLLDVTSFSHKVLSEERIEQILSESPHFSMVDRVGIAEIVKTSETLTYDPKEVILREGELAKGFFVILDGQVEAQQRGVRLRRMGRGQFFGETALVRGEPRSADIIAIQATTCLKISEAKLKQLMETNPQVTAGLFEETVRRNRPVAMGSTPGSGFQLTLPEQTFDFKSELAKRTFESMIDAFVHDYMAKRIVAEKCGWRSATEISRDTGGSLHVFYGKHGEVGSALKEPIRRGLVEVRLFPGERGRGGEVMRFRIAYEKEPIRAYVNQRIRTGKKLSGPQPFSRDVAEQNQFSKRIPRGRHLKA